MLEQRFEKVGDDLFLHHLAGTTDEGSPVHVQPIRCIRKLRPLKFVLTSFDVREVQASEGYATEHAAYLGGIQAHDHVRDIKLWHCGGGVSPSRRIKANAEACNGLIRCVEMEDGGAQHVDRQLDGIKVILGSSDAAEDWATGRVSFITEMVFETRLDYMAVEIAMPTDLLEDLIGRIFECPWGEMTITLELPLLVHEFHEAPEPGAYVEHIFEKGGPSAVKCVGLGRVNYVQPWRRSAVVIEKVAGEPAPIREMPSPLVFDPDGAIKSALSVCAEALRSNTAKSSAVAATVRTAAWLVFLGLIIVSAVHLFR